MVLKQKEHSRDIGWHKRRFQQIVHSIPNYISELHDIHNLKEGTDWLYYKFPYRFKLRQFPPRATVEFTNHCNFACGYCPRSIMSRSVGHMDLKLFESLVLQLEAGGCSILKIGGLGEPVLHPAFAQMMATLRHIRMRVCLYTNGSLFCQLPPEQICQWNIHTIVLSIDGLNPSSFEQQRKGGNYSEIRNAASGFASYKIHSKPILEIRHVIVPNETVSDLRTFSKDWLKVGDTVKFNYLIPLRPQGESVPSDVRCRDIRREVYIRWDGRLLLCATQDRQHPPQWLGDATKNSISELWFDVRLEDLRSMHANRKGNLPTWCQNCAFR
jgi:pyruvate-formate lyase-activating enzyme